MAALKTIVYRLVASAAPVLRYAGVAAGKQRVGIIMTHGVYDDLLARNPSPPRSSVFFKAFETNVLKARRAYTFVTMDEAVAMLSGAMPWRKNCVALTFDDSLKCHSEFTAPKLAAWGIPATFYLSTETIEEQRPYWWLRLEHAMAGAQGQRLAVELPDGRKLEADCARPLEARKALSAALRNCATPTACEKAVASIEVQLGVSPANICQTYPYAKPMNWEDARQLRRLGMTVGSHTVSHPNLTLLGVGELRREFETSRRTIEEQCAFSCRHLCYPHGFYSKVVCQTAREAGYISAVTTKPGWNGLGADLYSLGRFCMPGQPYQLPYILSGAAEAVAWLKRRPARAPSRSPELIKC